MKRYIRPLLHQFQTQPLLMSITVAGTALSIAFIMLYMMMDQVYTASFAPESNRDRSLHIKFVTDQLYNGDWASNASLGEHTIQGCILPLRTPEAVAVHSKNEVVQVSLPRKGGKGVEVKATNEGFWKVFDFTFISGKPYTKADVRSALRVAVIDTDLALELWNTTDVAGRIFEVDYVPYRVAGVVRPVSSLAVSAYARMWLPYTAVGLNEWNDELGLTGVLRVTILARKKSDFPAIRREFEERTGRFNTDVLIPIGRYVQFNGQPDDQCTSIVRKWANATPDMDLEHRHNILVYALLLLIPAVNLGTMLYSRLRQRHIEIGIRRSFGASRRRLMNELFAESFLVTVLGGVLGLLLCFMASYTYGEWMFYRGNGGIDPYTLAVVLFRWSTFVAVLLACLVLNFVSCSIPVWRTVGMNIMDNGK